MVCRRDEKDNSKQIPPTHISNDPAPLQARTPWKCGFDVRHSSQVATVCHISTFWNIYYLSLVQIVSAVNRGYRQPYLTISIQRISLSIYQLGKIEISKSIERRHKTWKNVVPYVNKRIFAMKKVVACTPLIQIDDRQERRRDCWRAFLGDTLFSQTLVNRRNGDAQSYTQGFPTNCQGRHSK
jgi:hypothetical protein